MVEDNIHTSLVLDGLVVVEVEGEDLKEEEVLVVVVVEGVEL